MIDSQKKTPGVPTTAHPVLGYLGAAAIASVFYLAWICEAFTSSSRTDAPPSLIFMLGFAAFFYVLGGFLPALILMIPPWMAAVSAYRMLGRAPGSIYFAVVGACGLFVTACSTASLAPKPLFVEDQTFLEGARIAADRQGACFVLAGLLFGLTYWVLAARRPVAKRPDR